MVEDFDFSEDFNVKTEKYNESWFISGYFSLKNYESIQFSLLILLEKIFEWNFRESNVPYWPRVKHNLLDFSFEIQCALLQML